MKAFIYNGMKQDDKLDCALDILSVIKLSVVSHERILVCFFQVSYLYFQKPNELIEDL